MIHYLYVNFLTFCQSFKAADLRPSASNNTRPPACKLPCWALCVWALIARHETQEKADGGAAARFGFNLEFAAVQRNESSRDGQNPECFELLQKNSYDLLLLDYSLPDMNGLDDSHRLQVT